MTTYDPAAARSFAERIRRADLAAQPPKIQQQTRQRVIALLRTEKGKPGHSDLWRMMSVYGVSERDLQ